MFSLTGMRSLRRIASGCRPSFWASSAAVFVPANWCRMCLFALMYIKLLWFEVPHIAAIGARVDGFSAPKAAIVFAAHQAPAKGVGPLGAEEGGHWLFFGLFSHKKRHEVFE